MARIFISSDDTYDGAWELAHAYAQQLRAQGLTETHRVAVERTKLTPRRWTFSVLLITEDPEDPTEE